MTTHVDIATLFTVIAGGVAGNHTVAGIQVGDVLKTVLFIDHDPNGGGAGVSSFAITDITAEFTITAANTINNTGGTDTTGGILMVLAYQRSPFGGPLNEGA